MRLLLLILSAICLTALGGAIPAQWNRSSAGQRPATSGGGGGSPTGPPVYVSSGTNFGTSGTLLAVTNSTTGAGNNLSILHLTWYDAATATIAQVTNNLGVDGLLYTNAIWEPILGTSAKTVLYYWTNSAMTYAVVRVAAAPSEWIEILDNYSNANVAPAVFSQCKIAHVTAGTSAISNVVSSASSNLVANYAAFSLVGTTPTYTATGFTIHSLKGLDNLHAALAGNATGATLVTNRVSETDNSAMELISFNITGF